MTLASNCEEQPLPPQLLGEPDSKERTFQMVMKRTKSAKQSRRLRNRTSNLKWQSTLEVFERFVTVIDGVSACEIATVFLHLFTF